MLELLFILFLFSGIIKSVLLSAGFFLPLDFTIITTFLLLVWPFITNNFHIKFQKEKTLQLLPFILLYIWSAFSLTYSPATEYAYEKQLFFITDYIPFAILYFVKVFDFKRFARLFVYFSVFFGLFYFVLYPSGFSYFNGYKYVNDFGFFDIRHLLGFGLPVGNTLVIAAFLCFVGFKGIIRIGFVNIVVLLLFSTGARAAIIAIIVILPIYLFLELKEKKQMFISSNFIKTGLLIVSFNILVFLIVSFSPHASSVYNRSFWRMGLLVKQNIRVFPHFIDEKEKTDITSKLQDNENPFSENYDPLLYNTSVEDRVVDFNFSKSRIFYSSSSIIFGYGIGSYGFLKFGDDRRAYPHNLFLEIWVELGLIGLLLMLWFFFYVFRKSLKTKRFNGYILIFVLFSILKSSSLIDLRMYMAFMAFALFSDGFYELIKQKTKTE